LHLFSPTGSVSNTLKRSFTVSFAAFLALCIVVPTEGVVVGYQLHKLLPDDLAPGDWFGATVGISGHMAIVGAHKFDSKPGSSGSVYLFDVTTGLQTAKLIPNDGEYFFGGSVAINGRTAIVGSLFDIGKGAQSGSAYVFDAKSGKQITKLLPSDGATNDLFGSAVAISGNTALIGAMSKSDNGLGSGAAYLFDISTGKQTGKLIPSDAAEEDLFGGSVAISDNIAIVGAWKKDGAAGNSGAAYLFDTLTGNQIAKLLPNSGEDYSSFGFSVGISGDRAIVGTNSRTAYLFDITSGEQIAKLSYTGDSGSDHFGTSVGISGNVAIVGAYGDEDQGYNTGSAYLFNAKTGEQIDKLYADDAAAGGEFGFSVAINGDKVVVGAIHHHSPFRYGGSAYLINAMIPEPTSLTLVMLASVSGIALCRIRL
jgi:WD40 repeat protein